MQRGWRLVRLREPEGPAVLGAIHPDSPRLISLIAGGSIPDVLELGDIEERAAGTDTVEALDEDTLALPEPWELLVPVDAPETWAAGVTYERSRDARVEESRTDARDVYSLVYDAERPELFLKDAAGRRTSGPGGTIGVRSDATWTVPEPELALVLGNGGTLLGATIGNDVSSRDIEGANPLYLPQAKIFGGACALGPAVLAPSDWSEPFEIELRILDKDGSTVFRGAATTERMRRSFDDLVAFLLRDNPVPPGSVLLTGTGLVPPDEVTLQPGQTVEVWIGGIGKLVNRVVPAGEVFVW
jgi:2-dehydro-3-deoxy-D-arabinonate dehydratase